MSADTGWTTALEAIANRLPFDDPAEPTAESNDEPQPIAVEVPAPAPEYSLVGVVIGVVPQAILGGIAGDARSVALRVGERVGDVRLIHVDASSATIDVHGERRRLVLPLPTEER